MTRKELWSNQSDVLDQDHHQVPNARNSLHKCAEIITDRGKMEIDL